MIKVEHNNEVYEIDENGFLLDPKKWNPNWADYVKTAEGIVELNDDHHAIINALRNHYQQNGSFPMVRSFFKCTNFPLKRVYELFPSGPGEGACKMAGLPTPFYLHQDHSFR
jgi:dissimilatory sulfite reductase related protein